MLLVVACRVSSPSEAPPTSEAEHAHEARAPESTVTPAQTCPELPPREQAEAAFADGKAQLEKSRAGDHFVTESFEPAIARLREAADGGCADAQALLGATMFGTMFTNDAPQPHERAAYVEAIAFLRTAAIASEPKAASFCPGLTLTSPPLSEPPLSEVPAEWVAEAWHRADAWLACHGPPWRASAESTH